MHSTFLLPLTLPHTCTVLRYVYFPFGRLQLPFWIFCTACVPRVLGHLGLALPLHPLVTINIHSGIPHLCRFYRFAFRQTPDGVAVRSSPATPRLDSSATGRSPGVRAWL